MLARRRAVFRGRLGLAVLPEGVAAAALAAVLQREVLVAQAQPPAEFKPSQAQLSVELEPMHSWPLSLGPDTAGSV